MLYDASAAVHLQGSLSSQAPLIAAVMDSLEAEVALIDQDGLVLAVNQAWRDFVIQSGGPDDSYVGRPLPPMSDKIDADLASMIRGDIERFEQAFSVDLPAGPQRCSIKARRVSWPGRPLIVASLHPIAAPGGEAAVASAPTFHAEVLALSTREMSAPLITIQSQLKRLDSAGTQLEKQVARTMIARSVNRMKLGLDTITFIVSLDAGTREVNIEPTSMRGLADLCTALTSTHEVKTDIHEGGGQIEVDGDLMKDVLSIWATAVDDGHITLAGDPATLRLKGQIPALVELAIRQAAAAQEIGLEAVEDGLEMTFAPA